MPFITGVVAYAKPDRKPFHTVHGDRWHLKFKMDNGQWYKFPFLDPMLPDYEVPVKQGDFVEFQYQEENNRGHVNLTVDKKSFVSRGPAQGGNMQNNGQYNPNPQGQGYHQPQGNPQQQGNQGYGGQQQPPQYQQQQQRPPQRNSQMNAGMAIGAALNQAVNLLTAGGQPMPSLADVEAKAWELLELADKMNVMVKNGNYPASGATSQTRSHAGGAQGQMPQQQQAGQGSAPVHHQQGMPDQAALQVPDTQNYRPPQGPGQGGGAYSGGGYDPSLPDGYNNNGGGYNQDFAGGR